MVLECLPSWGSMPIPWRFGRKRIGLQLGKSERIEWVRAAIKGSRMRRPRPATSAGGCRAAVSCSALRSPLQCQGGMSRVQLCGGVCRRMCGYSSTHGGVAK